MSVRVWEDRMDYMGGFGWDDAPSPLQCPPECLVPLTFPSQARWCYSISCFILWQSKAWSFIQNPGAVFGFLIEWLDFCGSSSLHDFPLTVVWLFGVLLVFLVFISSQISFGNCFGKAVGERSSSSGFEKTSERSLRKFELVDHTCTLKQCKV